MPSWSQDRRDRDHFPVRLCGRKVRLRWLAGSRTSREALAWVLHPLDSCAAGLIGPPVPPHAVFSDTHPPEGETPHSLPVLFRELASALARILLIG